MSILDFFRRRKKNSVSVEEISSLDSPEELKEIPVDKIFGFWGAVVSDVGTVRPNNEDNYILGQNINENSDDYSEISVNYSGDTESWYYAGVFDGMGGGEAGELASRISAQTVLQAVSKLNEWSAKTEIDSCLRRAFLDANNQIVDLQKEKKIYGTTGTVMCSNGIEFKIYHLGDSRGYLFRDGDLLQLTKDQTLAQMKIDVGMYDEDDPAAEADRHKLTEYIGRDWTQENLKPIESHWIPIQTGDMILLCSDGLYDMCTDEEIGELLRTDSNLEEKVAVLANRACSNGGEDNITCILIAFV